jgi:MFS transporter, DHA3 family, macrolide efflux protein
MTVLSNRDFLRVWIGQLVSQIGDRFYAIALAVWIAAKTGSPAAMALFLVASILPGLLAGPLGGAIADRSNRKTMLVAADFVRGLVVAAVAVLSSRGSLELWEVVAAAAVISMASGFFNPTLSASIPSIVGEEPLAEANSLSQLGGGVTAVLGPACGAIVLGFFGYPAVFACNAISFLSSGALIAVSRLPSPHIERKRSTMRKSLAEGMGYAARSRIILVALAAVAAAHFAVGVVSVSAPFLARGLIGDLAKNLGFFEAFLGLGMIAGSLALARLGLSKTRSLFGALSLLGFGVASMGMASLLHVASGPAYFASAFAVGMAVAAASISWTTILQCSVAEDMRGRVFGLSTTVGNATLPLAMAAAGLSLGRLSLGVVLASAGIPILLAGIVLRASGFRKAAP